METNESQSFPKPSIYCFLNHPPERIPILLAKIAYKYQGREETLSLLHYAISRKNNQAVKDLLEEAKKQKLLKEVLNEEVTTKHSDGREETHTILTDAISRRDNDITRTPVAD
ncbi:MAG: WD_0033/WD_0034 family tandem repeat-containing protein [Wolbachia sp.]